MTDREDVGPLRLAAQGLIGGRAPTAGAAVGRLLAVQGQDLPGALTSVALRTAARTRAAVTAALDAGEVVRSWPMRGTLHLVPADDLPWMLDVLGSRALRGVAQRWANLGLDEAQCERAREAVSAALERVDRCTRTELLAAITDSGVATTGQRGYHLLWYLAQTGTLCLGPTDADGDQLFVALDRWIPRPRRLDREEALAELALRFFTGHGPATVPDLVRWSGSTVRDVRAGLAAVRDRLEQVSVEGTEHFLDPGTRDRLEVARAEAEDVLLLPGFDEFVLGYGDRSAVLEPQYAGRIVPGGNGVFRPTVVHRGRIVGTWASTGRGARRTVTGTPFTAWPEEVQDRIAEVAAALPP